MHTTYLETVYAVHDFRAENEDEIGFSEGETILVLQRDDGYHDGWWKGQNMRNEIGLFPKSYIRQVNSPSVHGMLKKAVVRSLLLPELRSTSPEEWDIDQVQMWLHEMQFDIHMINHFKVQEITGDVLLGLTMDFLKELSISTFGKRFRLYTAIHLLKEEYAFHKRVSFRTESTKPIENISNMNPSRFIYQNQTAVMKTSVLSYDQQDDIGPDTKGWLYKQGCKYKQWNKRWFVLKGIHLFYFKSPEDLRMKGIINLRGYRIIPDESIQPGKYSFKAQHFEERTFYFYTDNETSMRQWMTPLMKATISRDFHAPVLSSHTIPTVSLSVARRMKPRPPSILLYRKRLSREEDCLEWLNATMDSGIIRDLQELRTGTVLMDLLEKLSGKKVRHASLSDLASVFQFLVSEHVLLACQLEDIQEGDRDQILILLTHIRQWAI
ncbi:hypothetical protein EDC96DRAFT_605102 [Choanephora cucurbitarum]|nr:hypothetical protein EDC96DRAFT_605102 [Choanephora cucurbitarum]